MKVLIVSDTHGHGEVYTKLIKKLSPMDLVIHCGDVEGQERSMEQITRETWDCPMILVAGNNDFFGDLKREISLTLEDRRILVTHGHAYYVSMGPEFIRKEAKARGYDIAIYGHTHKPLVDTSDPEILLINPGSLCYPRQEGHEPTYAVLTVEQDQCYANIVYMGKNFFA